LKDWVGIQGQALNMLKSYLENRSFKVCLGNVLRPPRPPSPVGYLRAHLQALLLLHSPHISTKPSTVLLGQLALADGLVLLNWLEAVSVLCQQLLDAHHLASLLLLGLLGLEATLVSRWPQQTRRFRTSHCAQLSCSLVWVLVLLELLVLLHSKVLQDSRTQTDLSPLENSQTFSLGSWPFISLPPFSSCLRRTLWLLNLWLHYVFLCGKQQKRRSSFH
uniref:Uncharacterized protein n=1 Tax=Labrus bergylta TaxID=56723 RepID=A0A3Q3FLQ3_9LABR